MDELSLLEFWSGRSLCFESMMVLSWSRLLSPLPSSFPSLLGSFPPLSFRCLLPSRVAWWALSESSGHLFGVGGRLPLLPFGPLPPSVVWSVGSRLRLSPRGGALGFPHPCFCAVVGRVGPPRSFSAFLAFLPTCHLLLTHEAPTGELPCEFVFGLLFVRNIVGFY